MRGFGILAAGAAVVVLVVSGSAVAEKVSVGNLPTLAELSVSPKELPKRNPVPAGLSFSAVLPTADASGTPAPAVAEITLLLDRNLALDFNRFPVCVSGPVVSQALPTPLLSDKCKEAIVGRGAASFEVRFPESEPVTESSPLLLINGGRRDGAWTLFARTEIHVPVPAAIVTAIRTKPVREGRYGTEVTMTIPKIAGGSGLLSRMRFKLDKRFRRGGRKVGVVNARCPDGKLQALAGFQFADGTSLQEQLVKPCTPREG